jgi:hypothetical protein
LATALSLIVVAALVDASALNRNATYKTMRNRLG